MCLGGRGCVGECEWVTGGCGYVGEWVIVVRLWM